MRSAAIGCAFASCAMVVGPGVVGIAQSHAILGIGPDIFDLFGHDKKSGQHHPRPGSEAVTGQAARTVGITTESAAAPQAKIGSVPESVEGVEVAESRGGGGGGLPRTNAAVRAPNLPRVSTAPITRNIVIRGVPPAAGPAGLPVSVTPALPQAPVVVPLAAPPPSLPAPAGLPTQAAPPAPSPLAPHMKDPVAPSDSGAGRLPDSFRVGYAEYLRAASTSDLVVAAMPGAAGIAGFTLVGAYAGYRQARAVQRALLAPVPTRVLL